MTNFNELQEETREIITDLLNDGSDPDALYIIEHHIAHYDFDTCLLYTSCCWLLYRLVSWMAHFLQV